MAMLGNHAAMSIGYVAIASHTIKEAGVEIDVITECRLVEISQCEAGRIATAFCFVTDGATASKPKDGNRSFDFNISSATHNLKRTNKRYQCVE